MKYTVLSPDGFAITVEKFFTCEESEFKKHSANEIKIWMKNYERQGYYSSVEFGRIPLNRLKAHLTILPLDDDESKHPLF